MVMGIRLQKAIFHNRAPFEHLELDFQDSNIAVLSGINGRGKTTILSHIVDAFYEMAKKGYYNEFEGKSNKFYRVSSALQSINQNKLSFVYLRFIFKEEIIDYLDIRNICEEDEYNKFIKLDNKIPYSNIKIEIENNDVLKKIQINDKEVKELFSQNILTYFPSYRYEQPGYLNDVYKVNLDFNLKMQFNGYLPNPIEVISDLPKIANWIMDIVLDKYLYPNTNANPTFIRLQNIISIILTSKFHKIVRFGIGQRQDGLARIQIMDTETEQSLYPSVFYLSSGEAALLCIFGELLKQTDKIYRYCENVTGVVLIDEVDKHLHIKLQKEVLPKLFTLFPNVQFIASSHSPFLNMGLADEKELKTIIFDLDNDGIPTNAENNDLYQEVYTMMLDKNNQYAQMYKNLKQKVDKDTKTLIITEGKTDSKHLQNAFNKLKLDLLDAEFVDVVNIENGDRALFNRLKEFAILKRTNKVIGIFDRDKDDILKDLNDGKESYKSFGNNVYGFAIPLVNESEYGTKISIEHYYHKKDLLKEDKNHRRLFLGEEFYDSSISKDGNFQTRTNKIQNKIEINGVIDEKVYNRDDLEMKTNIALTKNDFSDLVSDEEYSKDFDFSNFKKIYDIIKGIIEQ